MGTYGSGKRYEPLPAKSPGYFRDSTENLVNSAADMGYEPQRSTSHDSDGGNVPPPWQGRQPTVPHMERWRGYDERRVI